MKTRQVDVWEDTRSFLFKKSTDTLRMGIMVFLLVQGAGTIAALFLSPLVLFPTVFLGVSVLCITFLVHGRDVGGWYIFHPTIMVVAGTSFAVFALIMIVMTFTFSDVYFR